MLQTIKTQSQGVSLMWSYSLEVAGEAGHGPQESGWSTPTLHLWVKLPGDHLLCL